MPNLARLRAAGAVLLAIALGAAELSPARARGERLAPRVRALAASAVPGPQDQEPDDAQVRAAWKRLTPDERREAVEWFTAEAEALDTFQQRLLAHVLGALDRDPFDWPECRPPRTYDPKVHAPAQPIPRRFVRTGSSGAKKLAEKVFRKVPERRIASAWRYDWGARTVCLGGGRDDAERIFENALAGYPPHADLAEALVVRTLDDGSQQAVHEALGHVYADRSGNAYPDITLYDAWGSGIEMEMPDVECLGIVHDVWDDWKTWVAPIPGSEHDGLYERIGELFVDARRQRGVREAFARVYLGGAPALADGYGPHLDRLHALWEVHSSDPAKLAEVLPDAAGWERWMEVEGKRVDTTRALFDAGRKRRATLEADAARVRRTLVWVLRQLGAFEAK